MHTHTRSNGERAGLDSFSHDAVMEEKEQEILFWIFLQHKIDLLFSIANNHIHTCIELHTSLSVCENFDL